jgi:hypothetical protein
MKKLSRLGLPLLFLFVTLVLSACGAASQHQKAIEQAIVGYSDYYIVVRDLSTQVKDGYSKIDPKQSVVNYTISVEIPDYSSANFQNVAYTVPEPDATTVSAEQYQKKAILSIRQALETYALKNPSTTSYISIPVTFDVMSSGNGWTASITTASKTAIQQAVESSMLQILSANETYQKNTQFAQLNSSLAALLADPLGGAEYAALVEFSNVTQTADGAYTADVSYPDPTAVYAALGEVYVNSYNQSFYGDPITVSLTADGLSRMDTSAMPRVQDKITASYDSGTNTYALVDAKDLLARVTAARQQAEAAASDAVNATWRIQPLDPPASGTVLEGTSTGNKIVFKTGGTLGRYYYVRLYAISGEDVSEEGTLSAGLFLIGGKSATVLLPTGFYRVSCIVGDDWYGPDTLFGKDAKKYAGKNALESREGYVNTISFQ